ncbi:hypothetical protein J0J30_24525, partial [Vibrio vulnificus]|nr:hypothetical protein [Vibrio vulnificus]
NLEEGKFDDRDKGQPSSENAWVSIKDHPIEQVIGNIGDKVRTRRGLNEQMSNVAFVSLVEPKNIKEALEDEHWVLA